MLIVFLKRRSGDGSADRAGLTLAVPLANVAQPPMSVSIAPSKPTGAPRTAAPKRAADATSKAPRTRRKKQASGDDLAVRPDDAAAVGAATSPVVGTTPAAGRGQKKARAPRPPTVAAATTLDEEPDTLAPDPVAVPSPVPIAPAMARLSRRTSVPFDASADDAPLASAVEAKAAELATLRTQATAAPRRFPKPPRKGVERLTMGYHRVRLSDGPDDVSTREVGRLDRGDQVDLLNSWEGFLQVKTPDGLTGWIPRHTILG